MTARPSLLAALIVLSVAASGCTGWAWGRDVHGQIPGESVDPEEISADIIDVAAGGGFSCEIRDDRSLWCRGRNDWGQLGTGDLEPVEGAIRVGDQSDWVSITGGEVHACGITTDSTLMCWGLNQWGEVGDGTTDVVEEPALVAAGSWIDVATDWTGTCAIRDDGTIWCWGAISHPDPDPNPIVPTQLGEVADWTAVSGRDGHYCAIRSDHTLWCWGVTTGDSVPTQVGTDADWRHVDTGYRRTCATRLDWSLWCWGRDVFDLTQHVDSPALLDDTRHWVEFELSTSFTVAVTAE